MIDYYKIGDVVHFKTQYYDQDINLCLDWFLSFWPY